MHKTLLVPEREFGPLPWYAWMGDVTEKGIDEDLQRFQAMKVYEVCVIPLYGLKQPYLGKEYFQLWRHLCCRCREWGMKLWIYDEFNWPSGTAAGEVLEKYPDAKQHLIKFSWPQNDYTQPPSWEIIEYAGRNLASEGSAWSRWTCGYLNVLDRNAVGKFIELTHEAYKRAVGEFFGNVIVGFFTDEPVINQAGGMCFPYTADLFDLFRQKYGYELEPLLPALVQDNGAFRRVRRDYWGLIVELFKKNYFQQIADWCAANLLKLTGHLLFEEILAGNVGRNGDVYEMLSVMQVPGIDVLMGEDSFLDQQRQSCYVEAFGNAKCLDVAGKLLESVTFFAGKARNLCEAFGCAVPSSTARDYKRAVDFLFHHGVNIVNDNLFADSHASFRRLTACHAFWTPWVRHYDKLSQHIATMCSLNAGSSLVTNVGIYYPGFDARVRFGSPGTVFGIAGKKVTANADWLQTQTTIHELCHGLLTRHWNYYLLFDQIIAQAAVKGNALCHSGYACKVLILPALRFISPQIAQKISEWVAAGGTLVYIGLLPQVLNEGGDVAEWKIAQGKVVSVPGDSTFVDETIKVLARVLQREVEILSKPTEKLMVTHRRTRAGEIVFVTNFDKVPIVFKHNLGAEWREVDTMRRTIGAGIEQPCRISPEESRLFLKTLSPAAISTSSPDEVVKLSAAWQLCAPLKNTLPMPLSLSRQENVLDIAALDMTPTMWYAPCLEVVPRELVPGQIYWLRAVINLTAVPGTLFLTTDGIDAVEVYVGRVPVKRRIPMVIWDDDNISYDIRDMVTLGKNEICIKYIPAQDRLHFQRIPAWGAKTKDDLPLITLTGDFSACFKNDLLQIGCLPAEMHIGDFSQQGFPHFYGDLAIAQKVTLTMPYERAVLDLGSQRDTFEVIVNEEPVGVLCWPPYRLDLGQRLHCGTNIIQLRFFTARAGLTSRYYMSREKDLPPTGLLDAPVLYGWRK